MQIIKILDDALSVMVKSTNNYEYPDAMDNVQKLMDFLKALNNDSVATHIAWEKHSYLIDDTISDADFVSGREVLLSREDFFESFRALLDSYTE